MRSSRTVPLPFAQSHEIPRASRGKVSPLPTGFPMFQHSDSIEFHSAGFQRSRSRQSRSERACHTSPSHGRCLRCLWCDRLYVPLLSARTNREITMPKVWQAFKAEEQQGKDMVDAAKQAGVKHFIWTTLDYSEWHVPHFETKARVNDYLIASGLPRTS